MKKVLAASVAALFVSTPALAQDFDGVRFEGRIGWDRLNGEAAYDDGTDDLEGSDHEDGVAYGLEAGYDAQLGGGFVLGGYAGVDFSTVDVCGEVFGDDEACLEAGRNITVGLRAGLPLASHTLLYAKGGYSNGKVKLSYEDLEDELEDFRLSEQRDGFHVGAGAEMNFGTNSYGKLEYVYTSYNGYSYEDADVAGSIDASRHQVVIGLGYRF